MARELTIRLQTEQGIPLYRQIYNYVRDEIRSGSLEAGERLPSTRALASGLRVARSTAEQRTWPTASCSRKGISA